MITERIMPEHQQQTERGCKNVNRPRFRAKLKK